MRAGSCRRPSCRAPPSPRCSREGLPLRRSPRSSASWRRPIAIALVFSSTRDERPWLVAAFAATAGVSFVAAGLVALWRRPENAIGFLLAATGYLWFVAALTRANEPWVWTTGFVLGNLALVSFAALDPRLPRRRAEPARSLARRRRRRRGDPREHGLVALVDETTGFRRARAARRARSPSPTTRAARRGHPRRLRSSSASFSSGSSSSWHSAGGVPPRRSGARSVRSTSTCTAALRSCSSRSSATRSAAARTPSRGCSS